MAEAVLYNVASELLKKLGSVSVQEIGLVWGVKDELHKLANTVSTIRAALLDAEEQHTTNHEVRDWLGNLKDAVYAADDLLDDFSTEVLRRKVMTENKRGKRHLEAIGDQYFMDLLRRSFFHGVTEDEWGNVYCKMHDLIHDLAQSVAGIECSMENLDAKSVATRMLHVSFDSPLDSSWQIPSSLLRAKKMRTFLLPVQSEHLGELDKSTCDTIVSSFGCLRVLDFHGLRIKKVPNSIGSLSHLRELPREIKNLVSLRHLELDGCGSLTHMPHGLGQLTSLRTLTQFVVGHDSSAFRASGRLSELNGLVNLGGELRIVILRHLVKNEIAEAEDAKLRGNQCLESLRVVWKQEANDNEDAELLMKGLQPLQNLKMLHIQSYTGVNSPFWLLNLVEITLEDCDRCEHLPPFSQLPSLQVLKLIKMLSLEYIDNFNDVELSLTSSFGEEAGGSAAFFPSLKELKLYNLPKLKEWWRKQSLPRDRAAALTGEQQQQPSYLLPSFPCLSISTIEHCPRLISMPMHPWVEELSLRKVSKELIGQQLMVPAPGVSPQIRNTAVLTWTSSSSLPLSNLKSLYIDDIEDLVSLPTNGFQNLTSLERLEISKCSSLLSFPGRGLSGLTSLRFLTICFCESLSSLSQGIQHLTALGILKISNCPQLDLLDDDDGMQFQGLRSLTSLFFEYLPKLKKGRIGLRLLISQRLPLAEADILKWK
ncbi:hypothetical protein F0562_018741 [Nyssa sinensis]|uniref:Uncharacterized protein n=1 Tax=Nyssa sinensis TaxID=561372 RepID=A0A5J4ZDN4_9ASTE|nr:hypothetical protein F0562_018741 [Nyssa sinensis]